MRADGTYTLKIELDGFVPRSMEYTPGSDPGETAVCKYGDCDGDGKNNLNDLGRMQQYLCDWDIKLGKSSDNNSTALPIIPA